MQVVEVEPKPRLQPVLQTLEKFGSEYLYRFVDDKNLETVISAGTDRNLPAHSFRWYDEEEVVKNYGISKNQFTFARPLDGIITMLRESAKFDSDIYKGGFLILVYDANKMKKLTPAAYLFLENPNNCLEAVIKVREKFR